MTYSIKEMAELTGLPASTLRYYDKQGLLDDYGNLRLIDCLKRSGLSIKDIRSFIRLLREGDSSLAERREIFTKRREALIQEMANIQDLLGVIEYKCWYYDKACEAGTEANVKNMDVPEEFREAKKQLMCIHSRR